MALHFECLPTELDTEQVEEYLEMMLDQHDTPSESYFKFVVYSLRFAFKAEEGWTTSGSPCPALSGIRNCR